MFGVFSRPIKHTHVIAYNKLYIKLIKIVNLGCWNIYHFSFSSYDPYTFKEKSNYKPDVKLEYVDGKGRQLNQKEVPLIICFISFKSISVHCSISVSPEKRIWKRNATSNRLNFLLAFTCFKLIRETLAKGVK